MYELDVLALAARCPNYLLGAVGHGCALSGPQSRVFKGLPCAPLARIILSFCRI